MRGGNGTIRIEGSDTIYSEDMNHGQKIGSLTIINPFRPA